MKINTENGKISGTDLITILEQTAGIDVIPSNGGEEFVYSLNIHIFDSLKNNEGINLSVFLVNKEKTVSVNIYHDKEYEITDDGEIILNDTEINSITPLFPINFEAKQIFEEEKKS